MEKECKSEKEEEKMTEWQDFIVRVFLSDDEERDMLIAQLPDTDVLDDHGHSLMMYTIPMDYKNMAEALIKHGANVNAKLANGLSILQYAFDSNSKDVAEVLIEHGADYNIRGKDGITILMEAAWRGYNKVVEFASEINMVPLQLHKEQPGYILNSMLVPLLTSAQTLWAKEVADPETIDLTWRLATGAPKGPFEILDIVGLETAYNINQMKPEAKDESSVT